MLLLPVVEGLAHHLGLRGDDLRRRRLGGCLLRLGGDGIRCSRIRLGNIAAGLGRGRRLGQRVGDIAAAVADVVQAADGRVQPGVYQPEVLRFALGVRPRHGAQQGFKIMDQGAVTMQADALGYTLDGVQYPGHRGVGGLRGAVSLPGRDSVFQLLQFRGTFLDESVQEVGENLPAAGAALCKHHASRDIPGCILHARLRGCGHRLGRQGHLWHSFHDIFLGSGELLHLQAADVIAITGHLVKLVEHRVYIGVLLGHLGTQFQGDILGENVLGKDLHRLFGGAGLLLGLGEVLAYIRARLRARQQIPVQLGKHVLELLLARLPGVRVDTFHLGGGAQLLAEHVKGLQFGVEGLVGTCSRRLLRRCLTARHCEILAQQLIPIITGFGVQQAQVQRTDLRLV